MGPGGPAGGADRADALSLDNMLAGNHVDPREMEESAVQSMSMVDPQQIALQRAGAVGGPDHYPIGWRHDGLARPADSYAAALISPRPGLIDAVRSASAAGPATGRAKRRDKME